MFILTNDDGIDAPGIQAMRGAIAQVTHAEAVLVAPKHPLSGCSHQVTTAQAIAIERRAQDAVAVEGTPADCTRLGLRYLYPQATMVLSGINAGGNMGADVYISGTVAAVREAALLGVPGIAVSHYIHRRQEINWAIATRLTVQVLNQLLSHPLAPGEFWNVNLPHLQNDDDDPDIVFCPRCTQPLPTDFVCEGDRFRYTGNYSQRPRDAGSDVDVCFSGHIAVTKMYLSAPMG